MDTLDNYTHLKLETQATPDEPCGLEPAAVAMLGHRLNALYLPADEPPALKTVLSKAARLLEGEDQRP